MLENADIKIDGERIYLRTLQSEDANESYLEWLNNAEINRYLELRHLTHSIESIKNYLNTSFASSQEVQCGIFLQETKEHIGNIKLGSIHGIYKRAEIGLLIGDKKHWGKGFASEAIELITHYAFNELKLHRVQAGAYKSNIGSIKAFLKAGFVQEADMADYWLSNDNIRENNILLAKIAQ